jgi:hypothetical protein
VVAAEVAERILQVETHQVLQVALLVQVNQTI